MQNYNKIEVPEKLRPMLVRLKQIYAAFSILLLLFFGSFQPNLSKDYKVVRVVIDAGHGGTDPGAVGKKSYEKDITLAIALKVGGYIEQNLKNVKVIYTRKTDDLVELHKRSKIANENNADLFLSIHCNANRSTAPKGAETFVMGLHKSKANLDVAQKENASVLYEDNYITKYEGFDPNSPESYIIFSLYQNAFLEQSLSFASKVQQQMSQRVGLADRGVKQAGFVVLWRATMPSVLIETGFISNPSEEQLLISEQGQAYVASGIYRAFKEYLFETTGVKDFYLTGNSSENAEATTAQDVQPETAGHNEASPSDSSGIKLASDNKAEAGVMFKVQFTTSSEDKPLDLPEFKNFQEVGKYYHNGMYKFTVGNKKTMEEAIELQRAMQTLGYKDAFVVAFYKGERISPGEAINLLKQNN